jgi:Skp family chaperone for outer membrane proteins
MKRLHAGVALAVGLLVSALSPAFAQSKVMVINEDLIRAESKIGQDISGKLGAFQADGVSKLGLEQLRTEIQTEETALAPQTQTLTREALDANPQLKARVEALAKKQAEFMQKAQLLDANLEQQSNAGMLAFAQALNPAVDHVARQMDADVVLSLSSTWYVKDAVDISRQVIARLDATTPSVDALRASQPAPAAPAAPAP